MKLFHFSSAGPPQPSSPFIFLKIDLLSRFLYTLTKLSFPSLFFPYFSHFKISLDRGAPIRIVAVSKVGSRSGGLVWDGRHCFDGTPEEATIGRPLPERPSPVILQSASATPAAHPETRGGEPGGGFGGEAAAQRLDLFGDEGGGGDVRVAEVADLLEGLARGGQGVHVQRG